MEYDLLIKKAESARELAYAKYSDFKVGAALLTKSGKIYLGANIENASFGATLCAERVAMAKAVSDGERDFEAIAVVGGPEECPPCGICRQFMAEFCSPDFLIILGSSKKHTVYKLSELLPKGFGLTNMRALK